MKRNLLVVLFITCIIAFFFRSYLFGGKLLFPSNLLVSFYSPWNTEKYPGWTNIPFKGLGSDNLFIFYPMKTLIRKAVAEHTLPLWTPYNFSGGPVFGDGQSAPMYPLTYLYLLPSLPDAFSIMVMLVPFLTLLFTYGLLRHFKVSSLASLFGAVAFAFSGFMSVWMEENPAVSQSAIWLPLLVWMGDLLITQPRRVWFAAFAVATGIMMSSGFLQICIYELFFIAAYGIFRITHLKESSRIKRHRFALVVAAGSIGLLLVSPYLFMTWEAYKLSPRDVVAVPEIRSIFLVQWSHILSLFNPDWLGNPGTFNFYGIGSYYDKALFIGVIPLVFVLIGLFSKKSTTEKFFWGATAVTLALGFSSPFSQWLFSLPIPILSSMLPSRIFYLTSFALAIIAALAFDRVQKTGFEIRNMFRPVIAVYVAIIVILELFMIAYYSELWLAHLPQESIARAVRSLFVSAMKITEAYPLILMRNITVSVLLTVFTVVLLYLAHRQKKIRRYVSIILLLTTIASAWYFTNKSLYFGERQFVYPKNPVIDKLQEITGLDRVGYANLVSRIPAGGNVNYGWYSPEGINPVFALRTGQLLKSAVNGGRLTNDIPRITVELDLERANVEASSSARVQKLMSLLDMKYIVELKESGWYVRTFPRHKVVWEGTYLRIWQNPDVLPRAFVATNLIVKQDPQEILDALYSSNLRTTAIVEETINLTPSIDTNNSVTIDSYRLNDITMTVHSLSGGLLVLTDTYAPGWHAKVDGKDTPVYRTNFTFRGVLVPPGDHTVNMYYWPQSLVLGIYAMGGGILLLLGGILFIRWRKLSA